MNADLQKDGDLVSKHSYPFRQTPSNPVTKHQPEPFAKNADTFADPSKTDKEKLIHQAYTTKGRNEWSVNNPIAGRNEIITLLDMNPTQEKEPQEEDNALGCCKGVDAPDGGQGIGPDEMNWIIALCNGLPVPQEKRQSILRAIRNIRGTDIHQSLIESITGSDNRIAMFLDEAEREASANSKTNTAVSGT